MISGTIRSAEQIRRVNAREGGIWSSIQDSTRLEKQLYQLRWHERALKRENVVSRECGPPRSEVEERCPRFCLASPTIRLFWAVETYFQRIRTFTRSTLSSILKTPIHRRSKSNEQRGVWSEWRKKKSRLVFSTITMKKGRGWRSFIRDVHK